VIGDHVGADIAGQQRLGPKPRVGTDAQRRATVIVGELVGGDVQASTDQGMPARGGVGAVHDVHSVGDLAGAAQVLPLHTRGGVAGLLLSGLVQRRHP
jgi:hypothetical protein